MSADADPRPGPVPAVIVQMRDAVSSRAPERHRATLDTFAGHYGWVLTTDEVLRELRGRSGVEATA